MSIIEEHKIKRYIKSDTEKLFDQVAKEFPLTIKANGREVATLTCSPQLTKELAVGYLFAEGIIKAKSDILAIDSQDNQVDIKLAAEKFNQQTELGHKTITSGCGKNVIYSDLDGSDLEKVSAEDVKIKHQKVYQYVKELAESATAFNQSGGVHSALLKDYQTDRSVFCEDIGRHNAVDKMIGYMILNGYSLDNKLLIVSGRVSSEIMLKAARRKFPILISRSAPTTWSIQLAFRLGVTLIGFVRGQKMNIYTHDWRII